MSRAQILELRPLLLDLTVQGQTQQLGRLELVREAWRQWRQAAAALADRELLERERQRQEHSRASVSAALSIGLLGKADRLLAGFGAITLLVDRAFPCDQPANRHRSSWLSSRESRG